MIINISFQTGVEKFVRYLLEKGKDGIQEAHVRGACKAFQRNQEVIGNESRKAEGIRYIGGEAHIESPPAIDLARCVHR
jgi:hypothetical protein